MLVLFNYEFLALAVFSASLDDTRIAVCDVINRFFVPDRFELRAGELDLSKVYVKRPPAGGVHPRRIVLFEPSNSPGTTAMVANLEDGWSTMVNVVAQKLPGEHLLIRSDVKSDYPLADIAVWRSGTSIRYVRAMKEDPSWEFYQSGEPQHFEDVANYAKRRVRDRLNRDVLVEIMRRAGWSIDSTKFWRTNSPAFYALERRPQGV